MGSAIAAVNELRIRAGMVASRPAAPLRPHRYGRSLQTKLQTNHATQHGTRHNRVRS
jgi:hypothetical protein